MTSFIYSTTKRVALRGLYSAACVIFLAMQPFTVGRALAATTLPVSWTAGGLSAGLDSAGNAAHMAVDASGNVAVVSGPSGGRELAVTSYTADGVLRWRSTATPASGTFVGDWIAAAPNGEFVALGHNLDSRGRWIASTMVRYASNGALRWRVDLVAAPTRLVVDAGGNTYLAFGSSTNNVGAFRVQKYDASGVLVWQNAIPVNGSLTTVVALSLALSPDEADVVVTGDVPGGALWVTAAYDTATGTRRWVVTAPEGTAALDVAMDAARVYVTGQGVTGGGTPALAYFLTVVAYDRATGARLWRTDANPPTCCAIGKRIALAPDGSLVVAGHAAAGGYMNWWIVAMNTNGTVRWQTLRDATQTAGDELPAAVFVLADGTAVVSGTGGPAIRDILGNSYMQGVTVGYSPTGALLWEAFSKLPTAWAAALPNGDVCATGGYDALITCFRVSGGVVTNQPPTVVATAAVSSGLAPLTVTFSGSASTDPDGSIAAYAWVFGDGGTSNLADPNHTYGAVGTYAARLTVTDNLGATATSAPITITAQALATPSLVGFNPSTIKGGLTTIGTVSVSTAAGVVVALSSSNTRVASVPASVQVPAGSTSATFTVNTSRVKGTTGVTITATANGVSKSATLTVVK